MLKEAIQYINSLCSPYVQELNGQTWSDKPLHRIHHNPKAEPITLSTLDGLCDYLSSDFDKRGNVFVHVESPTRVSVFSALDDERSREMLVVANAEVPKFQYDFFHDHEMFLINLQTAFLDAGDRALLLKFAGTVESGTIAQYGDDGVTQKATVKTGVASKSDAIVPNPVTLRGYRTFAEVDQPDAQYVFRMREGGHCVQCALFEADGDAWKIEAKRNILEYLENALIGIDEITFLQ